MRPNVLAGWMNKSLVTCLREQRGRMEGTERRTWGNRDKNLRDIDEDLKEQRSMKGTERRIWGHREEVWIKQKGRMVINERRIWCKREEGLWQQRGGSQRTEKSIWGKRVKELREREDTRIRRGWFQRGGFSGSAWTGRVVLGNREEDLREAERRFWRNPHCLKLRW